MTNSDWDTYTEPPEKSGIPIWGKILVGCGILMFLLMASCVGVTYWAINFAKSEGRVSKWVTGLAEEPWNDLIVVVDAIKTDESALKLYRENRGLAVDYPTEEEFLKNAAIWRTKVADLPSTPPSMSDLQGGKFQITRSRDANRWESVEIRYRMSSETAIRLRWEDEKLVEMNIR
jgi:hypothetical protein